MAVWLQVEYKKNLHEFLGYFLKVSQYVKEFDHKSETDNLLEEYGLKVTQQFVNTRFNQNNYEFTYNFKRSH